MILDMISVGVLGIVSAYLVFSHKYDDGVIGRVALASIAIGAAVGFFALARGDWIPHGVCRIMLYGGSLFFLRHAYRYHRWAHGGLWGWQGAKNRRSTVQ